MAGARGDLLCAPRLTDPLRPLPHGDPLRERGQVGLGSDAQGRVNRPQW